MLLRRRCATLAWRPPWTTSLTYRAAGKRALHQLSPSYAADAAAPSLLLRSALGSAHGWRASGVAAAICARCRTQPSRAESSGASSEPPLPPPPADPPHAASSREARQGMLGELLERFWESRLWRFVRCCARAVYITALLGPLFACAPLARGSVLSELWWRWCVRTCERCGALLIKLAQWASSRPDLFSSETAERFAHLQDHTPPHAWEWTVRALDDAFGPEWRTELRLEPKPIGSGCIAQVHSGWLRERGGAADTWGRVAVKVLHPGVREAIAADMELLGVVASVLQRMPKLRWLNPAGMLEEFAGMLIRQLDLRTEARNLDLFIENFADYKPRVIFPAPIHGYVAPDVLVETYIDGLPLLRWGASAAQEDKVQICNQGIDAFCKMLFTDNFVHGDLHPGNIFVTRDGELALLDAGIALRYTEEDHSMLIDVLSCFLRYDGHAGGQRMLHAMGGELTIDADGFCAKIAAMVEMARDAPDFFNQIGTFVSTICDAACDHRVRLNGGFISIALSVKAVEGAVLQIDPYAVVAPRAKAVVVRESIRRAGRNVLGRRPSTGDLQENTYESVDALIEEARSAREKNLKRASAART